LTISDGIFTLQFLFARGERPAPPFPHRGSDASEDELGCARFRCCDETMTVADTPISAENIVFVIDRSGSMHDRGELALAKKVSSEAIQGARSSVSIGIIFVDARLNVFPPTGGPVPRTPGNVASMLGWITGRRGGSASCPQIGFERALEMLEHAESGRGTIV